MYGRKGKLNAIVVDDEDEDDKFTDGFQ